MTTIQDLQRKITLLDEYASTLQKQNIAKNRQTQTLYTQINDVRQQNDILRHHLQMIRIANHQRTMQNMMAASVKNSVQIQKFDNKSNINYTKQQNSVSCQTDYIQEINHDKCTEQISKLTKLITEKDSKIASTMSEGQEMYEAIQSLQQQIQKFANREINYEKAVKNLQEKVKYLKQENSYLHNQQSRLNNSVMQMKNQENYEKQEYQLLIKQNNQLIQKIRRLQKEKNAYYYELKNASPLKSNNSFYNQQIAVSQKSKNISMFQTKKAGMFVSNKTKMKNERWKMIQQKINKLKCQNEQIKANLDIK